ncbi:DUF998 domain-containing protein [Amycolatopsis regifaucium]|uniref:DUF998 domain-containing protein n=1 Tax=Amycolatopsis regifaucium TaxID=546365 RepID=A0A154M4N1_9PSEU|nr:DUF998 domain-containing protein [Amycolatopsis regifaucium]KZB79463.1 hypothetical protein AVL48_17965 [Amycolatopsis regifaucium]OKA07645.1 hypothetical protein ATP06_0217650 [Amycolatopsis regifaucium]SFH06451.1 Protein of unknown function [Amycolatopsis regifaucium]
MTTSQVTARSPLALLAAVVSVAGGALLILLLQVLPATSDISPVRRTISEYALSEHKWIFDVAVLLVAFGSAIGFGALIHRRHLPALSAASIFCALWTVSLVVIVAFPKNNWAIGPSTGGTVHRIASVVAFVALPLAVWFAAKAVFPTSPGRRAVTRVLAVAALAWFGVILGAIVISMNGGEPWWRAIPLGLVERAMALTGLIALASLLIPVRVATAPVTDEAEALRVAS